MFCLRECGWNTATFYYLRWFHKSAAELETPPSAASQPVVSKSRESGCDPDHAVVCKLPNGRRCGSGDGPGRCNRRRGETLAELATGTRRQARGLQVASRSIRQR